MAEPSDETLMRAIARKDHAAFAVFVRRHINGLHGYAARINGPDRADDLVQETLLRVWQHASNYRANRGKPTTWLYRVAHNQCIDALRRDRRANTPLAAEPVAAEAEDPPPIAAALRSLPESQRSVVLLKHVNGFSNRQVADIIGSTERAVESLLARARRTLRTRLSEET